LRVEQAQHITPPARMSAEMTRPPSDGDGPFPEAQAQFGAGSTGNVVPDDDGVEGVEHRVGCGCFGIVARIGGGSPH